MDEITYKIAEYAATASFDQLTDVTVHGGASGTTIAASARGTTMLGE